MAFSKEIEAFIKDFVSDLLENNVAIFAGAGMSIPAGFVSWSELLREIADELGLSVDKEHDLISLAQYHVNENRGKAKINRKILEEFTEEAQITENHRILARLPITTFWTTNYDTLIEDSLKTANKIVDTKHDVKQLTVTRPKRDVVVYKMHGDVAHPTDAILTKEQYEAYHNSHRPFVTALSGDLISKTFLFIGFSFTDPNLDYVLSRLNIQFGENTRQHYCFIKRKTKGANEDEDLHKYGLRKQELMINDLKRYKIKALLIDDYPDITEVLKEIERRYRKKTVFVSGSAEEYGIWDRNKAQSFIHQLSKKIVGIGFTVVNGFGWGVGSAVINGALEMIYERPDKHSEDQLIMRPFPQFETGAKKLPELWDEYRYKMISLAGIGIFIFGNKKDKDGNIIEANGVKREFDIAFENGLIPIPIGATGYISKTITEEVLKDPGKYYPNNKEIIPVIKELANENLEPDAIIERIIKIILLINK
ncbi:MAG: SIR2 family protein [Sphingobacteriia bacterium]|nr:SIR2 family protein [Sphingobacteriia bacterium]